MVKIDIKPLSVNACWQGKRFKTPKYKQYEKDMFILLPKISVPKPPYKVYYEFGFSSAASDLDNPIKPLQDILQKKYGFDDKHIYEMTAKRVKVKKGEEYLIFHIKHYEQQAEEDFHNYLSSSF
jgi:Holliday junction resolvase RusA-like endonuclease